MIEDIKAVLKICGPVKTLSDNDLDQLCGRVEGEILARKEKQRA